ncbi:hypothetical protein FJT64_010374 [Amphibalanus amphitrite]|uniref:Uncharacterized protein n=1 Tax=Amphibalanus amphitrite TaxID=1232801 RepID=A0A6A4V5I9_AMPAM|nr:hypothetical protein FJT64_010374 [Amphibalanus amphitrite]
MMYTYFVVDMEPGEPVVPEPPPPPAYQHGLQPSSSRLKVVPVRRHPFSAVCDVM